MRSSVAGIAGGRAHRRGEVERVLHVARGMLRRHVERFEVVVVVLELGPFDDEEAHAREDRSRCARAGASADGGGRAAGARPGSVTSTAPAGGRADATAAMRWSSCGSISCLRVLASWPRRGRSSAGAEPERLEQTRDQSALAREVAVAHRAQLRLARRRGEVAGRTASEGSRSGDSDIGSRFSAHGSRFEVQGSAFTVQR